MLARRSSATRISVSIIPVQKRWKTKDHLNTKLIEKLQDGLSQVRTLPNRGKEKSFLSAISAIRKASFKVESSSILQNIPGLTADAAACVSEVLKSDQSESDKYVKELLTLPGVGRKRAEALVRAGCRGLADIRNPSYLNLLPKSSRIKIHYWEHIRKPLTREHCEIVAQFLRDNLSLKHEVILVGPYRRGAVQLDGVINILLLHLDYVHVPVPLSPFHGEDQPPPKAKSTLTSRSLAENPLYASIVPALCDRGLLAPGGSDGLRQWSGVTLIPERDADGQWKQRQERLQAIEKCTGEFRELRLFMTSVKSRGAALIFQTGDNEVKSLLTSKAKKMGMFFDEFGLWKWRPDADQKEKISGPNDVQSIGFWQLLPSTTEEEIFEQLDLEYIDPKRRSMRRIFTS